MSTFPESLKAALAPVRAAFRQSHGDALDGIEAAIDGCIRGWETLNTEQRDQCMEYAKALVKSLGAAVEIAAKRAINEALRKHGGTAARVLLSALA